MKHGKKKLVSKIKANFDRTQYNLFSITLGGAGILIVLTHFNVPELNYSFLGGENPFAVKRDIIEDALNWIFTIVALIALLLQIIAEIWGKDWPDRKHEKRYYVRFSFFAVIAVCVLMWGLDLMGKRIAKEIWWPITIKNQAGLIPWSESLIEHDGWRADQIEIKDKLPKVYRETNLKSVEDTLIQIEKLLDLPSTNCDLPARLSRLKPYFAQ